MATTTESKKMITDGEAFEIEESVAKEIQTIKHVIGAESVIILPNINSKVLSKVIEYSKKLVGSSSSKVIEYSEKMFTLRSSDGEEFEIEESMAKVFQMIKNMIDCAEKAVPWLNVNSKVLSKLIEYSKKHVDSSSSKSDEKTADEELKALGAELVKVDEEMLYDLILAGTYLDHKEEGIKYSDYFNKELILYSRAYLQQSIPCMVDGLKRGQRKILFCAFKGNLINETQVAQFSKYVSEHSAYHYGDQSLCSTIVGMAQDFVGSNNINLFQPNDQFRTIKGCKDVDSGWYLCTCLSPITRFLFPKDDDCLLNYLDEDGQSIEPVWYMPVIPMVLVNGCEGTGTGWSSNVPNYNPRDVVSNVRRLLNDEPMRPMEPWYRGFKGLIEKLAEEETGVTYTTSGIIEEVDSRILRITELPIGSGTAEYHDFLHVMEITDFIQMERKYGDDGNVHFEVVLSEGGMASIQEGLENGGLLPAQIIEKKKEWLEKKFKLTTTIKTSNMHLFDSKGAIKKYDTPEQILEDFFHLRLQFYEKRKKVLPDNLEFDIVKLDNKVRFILGVVEGEIIFGNPNLFHELHKRKFTPFPKKTKGIDAAIEGVTVDAVDNEEDSSETLKKSDYQYLLSMSVGSLTLEKVQELRAEKRKLENKLEELRSTSAKTLWMRDLDALEKQLDMQELDRKAAEAMKMQEVRRRFLGVAVSSKTPKKPRKNNAIKGLTATAMKMQEVRRRFLGVGVSTKTLKKLRKNNATKGPTPTATDVDLGSTGAATTNKKKRGGAQGGKKTYVPKAYY